MVLSNKKLKQKLRTALAESIVRSESSANHSRGETLEKSETSLQSQSLNQILDSSIQKPRLSKREKRRKIRSLNGIGDDAIGGNTGVERNGERSEEPGGHGEEKEEEDKVNRKKRKRRKGKSDGEVNETDAELKEETKKKNKSKKAKKKRKNKSGTTKEKDSNDAMNKDGINASAANGSEVDNSLMSEVDAQKVYVGGIPYYSTEDDIRSYFESCGTIIEVDCMTFPESGRFRGIAFISFKTDAAAKRALALDGADMGGFFLKIQRYNASRSSNTKTSNFTPPVVQGYNRIYVGNLSWDITEEDLRKFLSGCNISSIRFGLDKETGEFRGYAHVDFSDSDSMNMALKLNQKVLYGRPVKVTSAIPKKNVKVQPEVVAAAAADKVGVDSSASTAVGSGKMRRRTCHLCGEKGHISSACSKNADEKQQPEAIAATVDDIGVDRSASTVVGSGKIRRRTCYLCGEKGHISSACPKNLDSPANSSKI